MQIAATNIDMPQGQYVGKRDTVTMPEEIFEIIEKLAKEETRSNSQTALHLIQLGIKAKGIELNS